MNNMENNLMDYEKMESRLQSQVTAVRAMLLDEHGLSVPIQCDAFICRCLRIKDGNMEKAVNLIMIFHGLTLDLNYWDTPRAPSFFENFYNVGTFIPLLKRDSLGRVITILRFEKWNPQEMNFDTFIAGIWFLTQYLNAELVDVQRLGYVAVLDCSKFSLEHAWAMKYMKAIAAMRWIQNGIIGRIKGVHFIFYPRMLRMIYSALRPFMKEKLQKRFIFHFDLESLHKQVGPEYLPNYLGGQLAEDEGIDNAMIQDLISKDKFFQGLIQKYVQQWISREIIYSTELASPVPAVKVNVKDKLIIVG